MARIGLKDMRHSYLPDPMGPEDYALKRIDIEWQDGGIEGMLKTLDPHSSFFDPREYAQMRERQEGRYYGLGIYNGDAGVVVREADGRRAVIAGANGLTAFATSRMSDVETMFATTIHKSQGSQADEVTVLLPPEDSRLLTRELFYTAVTRARKKVRVVGSEESVRAAVERRAQRASGLRQRLRAAAAAVQAV